jgi:2-C-methyl-D-erythritol 4-phosphate cytidylyltransferase / 2-C-methyl-D-erythritol 2,4-cyclodiphosphate synthase
MVTAIVAAAGRGRRFGAPENKIFAPLGGATVLDNTLRGLERCAAIDAILIVTAEEDVVRVEQIAGGHAKVVCVCRGGAERCDSVWNALQAVPEETTLVAVHDAARPLASPALIAAVIADARTHGAALPATPVSDTVKRSADGIRALETVDRRELYAVQTPQVFRRDLLVEAYRTAHEAGFTGTDDASYVERLGHPIHLTPGERTNLKITVAEDLRTAEALLGAREGEMAEQRTGFGYDVHQLVVGRPLVLGGVTLEHPDHLGLDGHSDADVLLHAISDALLGAAAMGDIGRHFPNTNPRYAGMSSLLLLGEVGALLGREGWQVVNVDAMLLAERPKISPHVDTMRGNIAEALGIEVGRVSIKATTNEKLGFEGREEGMAAHAVATIRKG